MVRRTRVQFPLVLIAVHRALSLSLSLSLDLQSDCCSVYVSLREAGKQGYSGRASLTAVALALYTELASYSFSHCC